MAATRAQQLTTILDSLGFAVTSVAPDGTILFLNELAARNLSGERERLIGRSLYEFFQEGAAAAARGRLQQTIDTKRVQHFEAVVKLPDGSERYFDSAYHPAVDDTGEVSCVQIVATDVTELRQAKLDASAGPGLFALATDDLSMTFERILGILQNAPVRITVQDPDMTIRYVNRLARDVKLDDVLGTSGQDWLTEDSKRRMAETFAKILETKQVSECQITTVFGTTFLGRFTPLMDGNEVRQILGCSLDITAQRQLEAQLRNKQKMESLGTLAGGIAHDFNNLLSAILGNAGLAERAVKRKHKPLEYLQNIRDTAHRAADLCEQLLTYAGREQFELHPGEVNTVIRDMTRLTRAGVSTKIRIDYELEDGLPLIACDATQLAQILVNLISNAAEAIGDQHGCITLLTDCVDIDGTDDAYQPSSPPPGRYVRVRVRDTGHGIPKDVRSRIFDPFYSTKSAGHGLGLSAVLGIVAAHGAAIAVDSTVGNGTTVSVLFPVHDGDVASDDSATDTASWTPGAGTVLVVDDQADVRAAVTAVLVEAGYDVLQAADGQEALAVLASESQPIAAIVLDVTMPRRDGHSTLSELRKSHPQVPVVLTSGKTSELQSSAPDANTHYLRKPYSAEQLTTAVSRALKDKPG